VSGEGRKSRVERITEPRTDVCLCCGTKLPKQRRTDMLYCDAICRRRAWIRNPKDGRVASVRRLKSGRMSVVVHMEHDDQWKPGDAVLIGGGGGRDRIQE